MKKTFKKIFPLLSVLTLLFSAQISVKREKVVENVTNAADTDIIMRDFADYLSSKKAHYPLSDEFIERYQQTSTGYIDLAKSLGLEVNKAKHLPDQKWHFFDSWFYPSIEDGTLTYEESAKTRVYNRLLCPELLLWIYEACQVNPSLVYQAKKTAEAGKVNGLNVSSIASQMRSIVSWEEVRKDYDKNYTPSGQKYYVTYSKGNGYVINGIESAGYEPNSIVNFTVSLDNPKYIIDEVKANDDILTPDQNNIYSFTICKNTTITVNWHKDEKITNLGKYNIAYDMGTSSSPKAITDTTVLFNSFVKENDSTTIINSINALQLIYGGGSGGKNETAWYKGDMLKFGSTSNNGSITFNLSSNVNRVKITGYTYATSAKFRIGDANSTDWDSTLVADNKTLLLKADSMNAVSKEIVETGNVSSMVFDITETNLLKIATTNKSPLFLTAIEFFYVE